MPDHDLALDLETTAADPTKAEILQIAAVTRAGQQFARYVSTDSEIPEEVWELTGIDRATYYREAAPLADALGDFLEVAAGHRLVGHNIYAYDLPILRRQANQAGLRAALWEELLSESNAVDTLRWAQLCFPTPPAELNSYRLIDLYRLASGQELSGAHQATHDAAACLVVLDWLRSQPVSLGVLAVWAKLGLAEGEGADPAGEDQITRLLSTPAPIDQVVEFGAALPPPAELPESLLPSRREAQEKMLQHVTSCLQRGKRLILQAPTGTGKTKGYLYPALHWTAEQPQENGRVIVATHTKALQAQAIAELQECARQGFMVQAVTVKSSRDLICPAALGDELQDSGQSPAQAAAPGVLTHFVARGKSDLESLPRYWDNQAEFRELRSRVRTNPARCEASCPYAETCAFQTDLSQRKEARIWVTNQAWLLRHARPEEDELAALARGGQGKRAAGTSGKIHWIIDEGHNLEQVATEAFSSESGEEELRHRLRQLLGRDGKGGLLKTKAAEREFGPSQAEVLQACTQAQDALEIYAKRLRGLVTQFGESTPGHGATLTLDTRSCRYSGWTPVRSSEEAWLERLFKLREYLKQVEKNSWLGRRLQPIVEAFQKHQELARERSAAVKALRGQEAEKAEGYNFLHQISWSEERGFVQLCQPIDLSDSLRQIWAGLESLTVTSATLAVPTDKDRVGFGFFQRLTGLESAECHKLPPSLPYEQAHLIVPSHLPEARSSLMRRFDAMVRTELRTILPAAGRSLVLFTSNERLREMAAALEDLPNLYRPLTRRERDDVAQRMQRRGEPGSALGTRGYMEGVDFPDLKLVSLERIPFPIPSPLLNKRQLLAAAQGLDPWSDVYLPRAVFSFVQAFGRLIRDSREASGPGAFVLWDKRLLQAVYQNAFFEALPRGVQIDKLRDRKAFYDLLAGIFGVPREELPSEPLVTQADAQLAAIAASAAAPLEKAERVAAEFWGVNLGDSSERSEVQRGAIAQAIAGRDLLVFLPTGFGKSLIYQVPALLSNGLTLVISPLIALMHNQVQDLVSRNLPAAYIDSQMQAAERRAVLDQVQSGALRLLYVSPERLNRDQQLRQTLADLPAGTIERVVFDEAHCLDQWGFSFRPDYLKAAKTVQEQFPSCPRLACTATASGQVKKQLTEHLGMRNPETITSSHDRSNLRYDVREGDDTSKFGVVTQVLDYIEQKHSGDAAIIYAGTRKKTEHLAWALSELGYRADAYHAGLSALIRSQVEERFQSGETKVVVATTAFGMGIDKANVRAVIHYQPPASCQAYLQESGRAGRDGKDAYAVLLYHKRDFSLEERKLEKSDLEKDQRIAEATLRLLDRRPGAWIGYWKELFLAVKDELEDDEGALEDDEGAESPGDTLEDLQRVVGTLDHNDVLALRYRLGKAKLLLGPSTGSQKLFSYLQESSPAFHQISSRSQGNSGELGQPYYLDYASKAFVEGPYSKDAEELNRKLRSMQEEQVAQLYHYQESAISLEKVGKGSNLKSWRSLQEKIAEQSRCALDRMRDYAKTPHCKRRELLSAIDEHCSGCSSCSSCDGSAPWELGKPRNPEEIRNALRPLRTILRFLEKEQETWEAQSRSHPYGGLGTSRIEQALRGDTAPRGKADGESQSKKSRAEWRNPLFGYLSFISEDWIRQDLEEAGRRGLLEVGSYNGRPTYKLSKKGRAFLHPELAGRPS